MKDRQDVVLRHQSRRLAFGTQSPSVDPAANCGNLVGAKLWVHRRHGLRDQFLHKYAAAGRSRDDRGTRLAALQERFERSEIKIGLWRVSAMAKNAAGIQDGLDVGFKGSWRRTPSHACQYPRQERHGKGNANPRQHRLSDTDLRFGHPARSGYSYLLTCPHKLYHFLS